MELFAEPCMVVRYGNLIFSEICLTEIADKPPKPKQDDNALRRPSTSSFLLPQNGL
ncbi:unnamed protein product [Sphenostylis stenocarpa]|uniref:Uncharacterized protein n=1 Tax=Sphenostylis stenocarpa TaxID=92480 RepID=A0AA86VG91_9FABA|nr:unnamed protein product [Sphenostylis stenocarpa]